MYPANERNMSNLGKTICVKRYIRKNQGTFIMKVPITNNCTYNYYKVYSIPIFHEPQNKTLSMFPKYPYLWRKVRSTYPLKNHAAHSPPETIFCVQQITKLSTLSLRVLND